MRIHRHLAIFENFWQKLTFDWPKKLNFDGGIVWPHGFLDFRNLGESKKPCGHPQISSKDRYLDPPKVDMNRKMAIFGHF